MGEKIKKIFWRALALIVGALMIPIGYGTPVKNTSNVEAPKNVIVLIGDGMGDNTIKLAERELGVKMDAFSRFEHYGHSKTKALGGLTTDSAAGSTAIACGIKTVREAVGVFGNDIDAKKSYPMNLTELAMEKGKSTGIVTNNFISDATPADFSVHASYRGDEEEIIQKRLSSGIDLMWGCLNKKYNGKLDTGDYKFIENASELGDITSGTKTYGMFSIALDDAVNKATKILSKNENGFFLMVENDRIDIRAEENNKKLTAEEVLIFNKAINAALDFAEKDGNTVVIVTADHETGGIKKMSGKYAFTTTMHTNADVPVYVFGTDAVITDGKSIQNSELGIKIAHLMGADSWPKAVKS